jgi:uncharacterized protein (PEP-CTERM system associated)
MTPYVQAWINSYRGTGFLTYSLRAQYRENDGNISHNLAARGDFRITDEMFRISAGASVSQINVSPFGQSSYDPSQQSTNTTQYRDLDLSPYALGLFDGNGNWNLRYRLRYTSTSSDTGTLQANQYPNSLSNMVNAYARTDLTKRQFGLSGSATAYQVDYQNNLSYTGQEADLLAWIVLPTYNLRVGAGVGYAENSRLTTSDGKTSGIGPSASVEWTPLDTTSLSARWAERYYGPSASVTGAHRRDNWGLTLTYGRGISDGLRSGMYGVTSSPQSFSAAAANPLSTPSTATSTNPLAPGGSGGSTVPGGSTVTNLLWANNSTYSIGYVNSPIVYFDNFMATATFLGSRSAASVSAFMNNRRTAVAFIGGTSDDLDQRGMALSGTFRLDPVRSLNATLRYTMSESSSQRSKSNLAMLLGSWDWNITPRSTLSVGGRLQRQTGSGTAVEFDEVAAFVSADHRFD